MKKTCLLAIITFCLTSFALASNVDTTKNLRILSYNIKMLPRGLAFLKHHPIKRAKLLPKHLIADSVDVIVFQEAFDPRARQIIRKAFKKDYPYMSGPANNWVSFKVNSGVMMFSRIPMKTLGQTKFSTCEKEDCMARKGGLIVEVKKEGKTFQVLGTHLEAGGPREMKISQYYQLRELSDRFCNDTTPLFMCGDFNTRKSDENLYPVMLNVLGAEDGDISGELQCTSDHATCDMDLQPDKSKKIIDYILVRKASAKYTATRTVKRFQQRWHKNHQDLSDHYALFMDYKWNEMPEVPVTN